MNRKILVSAGLLLVVVLIAMGNRSGDDGIVNLYKAPIAEWPQPIIDDGVEWEEFASLDRVGSEHLEKMSRPLVQLGRMLFFDPILSGSNQISCSSCHDPQTAWADKLTVPIGHDHLSGTRNTPSLLNVHARETLFWDGRAATLEEQALAPIEAHHEMNMNLSELIPKLKAIPAYKDLFEEAYGPHMGDEFSIPEVLRALGAFQRTIISRRSKFDEFLDGRYHAMTDQQIRGMHLFRTKARCMNCHHGPFLTDELFHNIGLTYYQRKFEDLGRYDVTGDPDDVGKFRTPSLRDIMNTGPWMHNGLFGDIIGVLNIYNSGMQMNSPTPEQKAADPLYPVTDPLMKPLDLTDAEILDIKSFLEAITGINVRMRRPEAFPR